MVWLKIANRNKRISFEELSKYQNDEAHWIDGWVDSALGTVWAEVKTIRGNEFILAGAEQAKVSGRINMRYRPDIVKQYFKLGEKLRLNLKSKDIGDRVFDIVYINNLEEKDVELEFIVNEVR